MSCSCRSSKIAATTVTVGTDIATVSASNPAKLRIVIQADRANTSPISIGESSTALTAANGFGELLAGDSLVLETMDAIYAISGAASQKVRVLTELR